METARVESKPLICVECGAVADGQAGRWRAYLAGGHVEGHDLGELEVGVYWPACAEAEFGD